MATLKLKNIDKVYDNNVQAVFDFNIDIEHKEFIVFVGPSGCGKSTTLRMIAGLEEISAGELYIDDVLMNDVAPKDRNIAMVFQNYALYPHMNVYDNMAFGLKLRKFPKDEIERRVQNAADILGLKPYLDRRPKALSGGQRQRVALGRAIVRDAKVFLMDEPLSNLDAKLRVTMRSELIKLHESLDTTTIYVTHDQVEAMTMATRIVVMKDGYIQQIGAPKEIYDLPNNLFVGGFIGSPPMNFIKGKYANGHFISGDFNVELPKPKSDLLKTKGYEDKDVILGIRPEHISDKPLELDANAKSRYTFDVDVAELLGSETIIYTELNKQRLIVKVDARADLKLGGKVDLALKLEHCHFFDPETELRILK